VRSDHIVVRRTARYHTLGDPGARELWVVCHGYAQLARYFLRAFTAIDDGSRFIVAPEALNRYYHETAPGRHAPDARVAATWMTREDREHEIADYVAYLDALHERLTRDVAPAVTVVLGFSQGAATVSRWAARGAAHLHHVVLWGSSLAHELEPAPGLLRGAGLTIAIGAADPQIPPGRVDVEDRRIRDAGIDYTLVRYDGGHSIEPDALVDLARRLRSP
jgi:predicted esterase